MQVDFSTLLACPAVYNECVTASKTTTYDDTAMSEIYHLLLVLIAPTTDRELAKYVECFTWNISEYCPGSSDSASVFTP